MQLRTVQAADVQANSNSCEIKKRANIGAKESSAAQKRVQAWDLVTSSAPEQPPEAPEAPVEAPASHTAPESCAPK